MESFNPDILHNLYIPPPDSHKGDNGKLLIIGGSKLFHAASLWSLEIASKIVDMVFYSSVPENNQIVQQAKASFRNGIIVPREKVEDYVKEADCILIGPGLPRPDGELPGDNDTKQMTEHLLSSYPEKKWVIDGGSLQTITPDLLPKTSIVTPHLKEFDKLFDLEGSPENVQKISEQYGITVVLKGEEDVICSASQCVKIPGGNAGMTKGGTGDVLAGLVAALYCKNDAFLSAAAGSYFNKKAGEVLFERAGYYFNATDLVNEIPKVMKEYVKL